jgi:hypothetical protein
MPALNCVVLQTDGPAPWPCVVRLPDGRVLRLHGDAAPKHARWFGMCDGVTLWAEPADATGQGTGEQRLVDVAEAIDEVGVALGPDLDVVGLFDASAERSATGERTLVAGIPPEVEQRRTSLLAWIAANADAPASSAAVSPCTPLRGSIADEPPDALPALARAPSSSRGNARITRTPPAPAFPLGDPDDTATQMPDTGVPPAPSAAEGPFAAETTATASEPVATTTGSRARPPGAWQGTSDRVLNVARGLALVLLVGSALAWWYLG